MAGDVAEGALARGEFVAGLLAKAGSLLAVEFALLDGEALGFVALLDFLVDERALFAVEDGSGTAADLACDSEAWTLAELLYQSG